MLQSRVRYKALLKVNKYIGDLIMAITHCHINRFTDIHVANTCEITDQLSGYGLLKLHILIVKSFVLLMILLIVCYIGSRTSSESESGRDGYIIMETNFRLCAYTS